MNKHKKVKQGTLLDPSQGSYKPAYCIVRSDGIRHNCDIFTHPTIKEFIISISSYQPFISVKFFPIFLIKKEQAITLFNERGMPFDKTKIQRIRISLSFTFFNRNHFYRFYKTNYHKNYHFNFVNSILIL